MESQMDSPRKACGFPQRTDLRPALRVHSLPTPGAYGWKPLRAFHTAPCRVASAARFIAKIFPTLRNRPRRNSYTTRWDAGHSTKKLLYRLLLLRPKVYYENGKPLYTHDACLLTSDHTQPPELLLQAYLWRWAIECNHRDSKTNARIGKAHCRVERTVTRVHPAVAAGFALLWLCILKLNGGTARTEVFLPHSHWQKANLKSRNKKRMREGKAEITPRASSLDVLNLFRHALHGAIKHGVSRIA